MSAELRNAGSQRQVDNLVLRLRRRQLVGSRQTALETVLVLRQVITKARFSTIDELIELIKSVGRRLVEAQPKEHTVGNTVRKVLHCVREEYNALSKASFSQSSLRGRETFSIAKFVLQGQPRKAHAPQKPMAERPLQESEGHDVDTFAQSIKPVLMEAIQDVLDELETVYDNVSKGAKDHIHSDEIILTIGKSATVEAFLKTASHHRNFTVIVAETAPSYSGHEMARSLSSAGISTFLVPDSSVFAMMSRVNKVILGAHAILANGGMFAITGSLMVATAAKALSTPVVVCAGQFKLTPLWNLYHEYGALDFADPSKVLGFEHGNLVENTEIVNPYYDYVHPELLDVYITNDGDHPPTSVYRLIKESYDDDDHKL